MQLADQQAEARELSPAGFRSFYEEVLPRVYGYFLHRCGGSVQTAEDLTQETFLASVAELKKGRRPETPVAWVLGIARHKLIDHYRRSERSGAVVGYPDQRNDRLDSDTSAQTVEALASVPQSQRAALVLCYMDGFTMAEAAALLGKTPKAVEGLLGRGSESFKRAYLEVTR